MIENLPAYVTWVFVLTAAATVAAYLYALRDTPRSNLLLTASVLLVLSLAHAALAYGGFYRVNTSPPRFPLAPVPTTLTLLALFFAFARGRLSDRALRTLTLLSAVRVPVELVLLWLYQNGQVPRLMTFEGRNFDILSGLTAPLVAWFAFRGGRVNRPLLVVWNVVALGLLLNIVANAVLSIEGPLQHFAFDRPNRGVLYFPFIWLPAVIVPVVFTSHVISLWRLRKP